VKLIWYYFVWIILPASCCGKLTYNVVMLWCTDMEKTNSEYERKSPSSADTRIRKYQVRMWSLASVIICYVSCCFDIRIFRFSHPEEFSC